MRMLTKLIARFRNSTLPSAPFQAPVEPELQVFLLKGSLPLPRLGPIRDPSLQLYSELAGFCDGAGE